MLPSPFLRSMLFGGGMAAVLLLAFQAIQREQSEAHRPSLDAPFVASLEPVVERMLALAEVGPTDHVVDLGCGDGRIVVAAARDRGATGLGVDLDPARIREAEAAARSAGVDTRVRFRVQNLFETGIADADVVALYLLPELNLRLRPRLLAELRPGARIVSHAFDMGDWPPDRSSDAEGAKVYVWVVPAPVAGRWTLTDPAGRRAEVALDQRFQTLSGTASAGGQRGPLRNPRLSGDRVRFTANLGSGPQTFEGQWSQGSIALSGGWRMERAG